VNITTEAQEYVVTLATAAVPIWRLSQSPAVTDRNAVFNNMLGLVFRPIAIGRLASGMFPAGGSDPGFVEIDDTEFVVQ
jgi:hypothetical protein